MAIKVGINGFGRIGRNVLRAALNDNEIDIVAVNDLTGPKTLAHLLKYDSVLGICSTTSPPSRTPFLSTARTSTCSPRRTPPSSTGAPSACRSWSSPPETSRKAKAAKKHLRGTVKKVIISAPAKNEDITIVLGVNEDKYDPAKHHIISNASCTTNCLAPVAKVLHDKFGIAAASMTTIHSYTNDQVILDLPHKTCAAPAPPPCR